ARCGGEEEPFPDREILVVQGKAEVDTFTSGCLVRFVEDRKVERISSLHSRGDDMGRLVSGEDKLHALELRGEKCANLRAVGADGKIEIGRTNDKLVAVRPNGRIRADAEMRKGFPRSFPSPLVQGLAQQSERRNEDEDVLHAHALGNPQRDERLARAASHQRGGAVVLAQRGEKVVDGLGLMRKWIL